MEPLMDKKEIMKIFLHGLLQGYWSIDQFNKDNLRNKKDLTLPSHKWLKAHPEFEDPTYRDLNAFNKRKNNENFFR